jgi:GxxExxY protein
MVVPHGAILAESGLLYRKRDAKTPKRKIGEKFEEGDKRKFRLRRLSGMDARDHTWSENRLSFEIIGRAIEVHKVLGPGLLESAYQRCLEIALTNRGLVFETEKRIPLIFQNIVVPDAYRLDLIVEGKVIIEIKSVQTLLPVFHAQLLTYLRITGLRLGLLFNFNVPNLPDGIHRVVNKLF